MAIDTRQKRMSAMNPMCPWRGVLVDASEAGFSAGKRAAADYAYGGAFPVPPPPVSGQVASSGFISNMGPMMARIGR